MAPPAGLEPHLRRRYVGAPRRGSHGYRIDPGQSFDSEIERELGAASCVLVVWSNTSVESDWVREEADDGLKRDILVPVQIDDCTIPLGFRRKQAAQLSGWPKQKHDLAPLIKRPPIVYVLGWMSHLERGFNSPVYDKAVTYSTF